jgi:hypothetical protein
MCAVQSRSGPDGNRVLTFSGACLGQGSSILHKSEPGGSLEPVTIAGKTLAIVCDGVLLARVAGRDKHTFTIVNGISEQSLKWPRRLIGRFKTLHDRTAILRQVSSECRTGAGFWI